MHVMYPCWEYAWLLVACSGRMHDQRTIPREMDRTAHFRFSYVRCCNVTYASCNEFRQVGKSILEWDTDTRNINVERTGKPGMRYY